MKSRNFLFNNPTVTNNSAAKGLLLTRSLHAATAPARINNDGVAASAARRFELQHNQSPRYARRRQERRQGQALLLAVLIMLLAALLSAGFLAVVSGNLNQSARVADKSRAIESSRAGIAYANAQLSGSSQGDLWRPVDVNPAPAPGTAGYDFYYSQLDKVQGWGAKSARPVPGVVGGYTNDAAGQAAYETDLAIYKNATYGKFPDPTQPAGDAPKFLVKVREVPANTADPDYEADHVGEVKITSIGLSDDDPNVFHRAVAYKTGRKKSPWASALRSVSNWRFGTNDDNTGVPYARVIADQTIGTPTANVLVPVDATNAPAFAESEVPFNVVLIKKDTVTPANSTVRGAVVIKVDNTSGTVLTLARLDSSIVEDEVIQKAAAIGTGSTIDLLNTGTTTPPTIAATFPNYEQPNGILANGSLWLQNQVRLSNLSSKLTSNTTNIGTQLITSGSLVIDDSAPNISKRVVAGGDMVASPTGYQLVPSNVDYPGTNVVLKGTAISDGVEKTDIINDGWDKINSVKTLGLDYIPDQGRTVEPFTPVKIDSAQNLARYRALTRNAETDIFSGISYSKGIYVDNRDDFEKVDTRPMTQAELVDMLISPAPILPATPAIYARTGTAEVVGTVGKSLEQKHLRGWVGPDEFLARGALIEILQQPGPDGNSPSLRVTLDARADSTTATPNNDSGPVAAKAFRKADGTFDTGVYTKILPWPSNGTIFAEGNIRIRGNVGDPATNTQAPRSLTVVSLNNIYVEGSLSIDNTMNGANPSADRKKLMLLAKKNVIVNPTRAVLARTDVATVATNETTSITLTGNPGATGVLATPANFNIPVADILAFNKGDYAEVTIPGVTGPIRGLVTDVNFTNKELTIRSTSAAVIPPSTAVAPIIVRSPLEKSKLLTVTTGRELYSLVDLENSVNRRIVTSLIQEISPNRNRIVFDHVGEARGAGTAKEGLKIKAEDHTPPNLPADPGIPRPTGFTAILTNKQPLIVPTPAPIPPALDPEDLDAAKTGVAPANKILRTYNNFSADNRKPFSQVPTSPATTKPLSQLVAEIIATPPEATTGPDPKGYRYTASLTNITPEFAALPSNALAGIGLRYDVGTTFVPPLGSPANNRRQDFNTTTAPEGFTIPLATSVEYNLNGGLSNLLPTSGSLVTKYIGFAPDATVNDDALTVDGSFYQFRADNGNTISKSTLDSRVLSLVASANPQLTAFPQSIVLQRTAELSNAATSALLPNYEMRSMKLENDSLVNDEIKPVMAAMQINAFVYAQEGSWLVIPGDYFRSNPPVRGIIGTGSTAGQLIGSYIDHNTAAGDAVGVADADEYILDTNGTTKVADLNRNGKADGGEREAALRFVRYNMAPIKFYGAIIENQTAVVADVKDAAGNTVEKANGAVQDWMDKWATYNDDPTSNPLVNQTNPNLDVGKTKLFSFISYAYDPSIANNSVGANGLRVPVTDDLLYEQ